MFIHSCVDGHLSCYHLLANANNAAVNTVYKDLFEDPFSMFLGLYVEEELLGHMIIM